MQLLHRNKEAFFLFTRAGRVGYEGTQSIDCFLDKEAATQAFKGEFYERTGIKWDDRYDHLDDLPPKGKYQYILMKYDNEATFQEKQPDALIELDKSVASLVETIYNPSLYDTAKQMGLDTAKLPLGNLGRLQIIKAYRILTELNVAGCDTAHLSSLYYSTIPTACGMAKLPLIDSPEKIKEKLALLELLEDVCCLNTVVDAGTYEKYKKLECDICPVTDRDTLRLIDRYMTVNRGSTHSIKLRVHAVYNLDKLAERNSYRKWETLHNKQLLWHGTRMANVAGILTNGLKINPVGIPTTGKMFGNGLYFANSSTKSAGYMYMSGGSGSLGALFLCEVALGNMYELKTAQDVHKLPGGKHSTKGLGMNVPDEEDHLEIENNVVVPIGTLKPATDIAGKALLYDEFIVYDTTQVKLRYLVLVGSDSGW